MSRWPTRRLGDVLVLEYGKPLPPNLRASDGTVPVYGANGIKDWTNSAFREEPTIIVGRKGSAGEIQLSSGPFWPLDVTYFVDFDRGRHHLKFLYYLLDWIDLRKLAKGIKPGVNRNEAYDIPVPVPPLEEQRWIVRLLDAAFTAIATATANAEKNLANARELPSAALTQFDLAGANAELHRLGDLVTRLTNGYVGPTRNIYVDEGIPYLLARHVRDDVLTFDGRTHISPEFNAANKKSILASGDVLLVQSGHIGHSAVVPPEHAGHNCHAMIVITTKPGLLGEYLSAYFNSIQGRDATTRIRSGSTVPHLTCREVRELMIPVPSLEAQGALLEKYNAVQFSSKALADVYLRKLASLSELKQSLLHRAFSGELTEREPLAA
ncbi:restriction endonuclease subunit S [Sphingomonas mesophila]|uniref:restriction endonuclease subunit S n=1 Tax=Sphingomonas mesophila TaxID=2303576 RepID=UPI000E58A83D|nr:restriction endonuclease subunit S [Sphingomonas mesophila]